MIVIALMTIVGAIVAPLSIDYQQRNDLDIAQTTFVQCIRRAQQMSMAGEADSAWGLAVNTGNIIIFKGVSFLTRDTSLDENYDISSSITFSGQSEYSFAKTTGLPSTTGSVTLTNSNYQKSVSLNEKGIVNY